VPALHHSHAVAPIHEYAPVAQLLHVATLTAAAAVLSVPAGHPIQPESEMAKAE
jgi:hypothetical protein